MTTRGIETIRGSDLWKEASQGTSAHLGGFVSAGRSQAIVLLAAEELLEASTTAYPAPAWEDVSAEDAWTQHVPWRRPDEPRWGAEVVTEIRQRSGLTWEQIARLVGVARRSLHLWAKGRSISAPNADRLRQVLALVRSVDTGDPKTTKDRLLTPSDHGQSLFEAFTVERGTREARAKRRPPRLSPEVRERRRAFSFVELLGEAEGDDVPPATGEPLPAIPLRPLNP